MPPSDTWSDVGLNHSSPGHSSTNYITISLHWCCASVTVVSAEASQLSVQDRGNKARKKKKRKDGDL